MEREERERDPDGPSQCNLTYGGFFHVILLPIIKVLLHSVMTLGLLCFFL